MREAGARHVPLTVVTVYQMTVGLGAGRSGGPEDDTPGEHARVRAIEQADKAVGQLGDLRPPAMTIQSVRGSPADELMKAAGDADMLVVAAGGAGGSARVRLGSVTIQLAHHARCPLVIIPPDETPAGDPVRTVLAATEPLALSASRPH